MKPNITSLHFSVNSLTCFDVHGYPWIQPFQHMRCIQTMLTEYHIYIYTYIRDEFQSFHLLILVGWVYIFTIWMHQCLPLIIHIRLLVSDILSRYITFFFWSLVCIRCYSQSSCIILAAVHILQLGVKWWPLVMLPVPHFINTYCIFNAECIKNAISFDKSVAPRAFNKAFI